MIKECAVIRLVFWSDTASAWVGQCCFWACFNSRGPGALIKINVMIYFIKYQAILADNLVASATSWTFQQDPPKHTSKSTQTSVALIALEKRKAGLDFGFEGQS